jgi:hypothetical protein
MKRKHHVIVVTKDDVLEVFSSLVAVCKAHPEFVFHTIKAKKFPFYHKGFRIRKFEVNKEEIDNRLKQ